MLDQLLGRAELKDELAARDEEVERLERRLAAEEERRATAVSARQDAEERVNRLEDRIAGLEGQLDHSDAEADGPAPDYRRTEALRGERTREVLARLQSVSSGPEGVLTAMVADAELPPPVREAFGEHAGLVARAAPCLAATDDAGLLSVALDPPNPPEPFCTWDESVGLKREWFLPTGRFALALVRADLFALGEYDGRERLGFEGFESRVKGDHSKGGFSQGRFERLRDGQIDEHLERCREAVDGREADRLFVVGEREAVAEFRETADATATVDATGDPADALEDAFRDFWTTRLSAI